MAKIQFIYQHPDIAVGLETLLRDDKKFSKLDIRPEHFTWKKRAATFPSFLSTIVSQQISTKAAASIYKKLHDRLEGEVTPENLLALEEAALRGCGLSSGKVKYARGLAEAILNGDFKPSKLRHMSDEDVIEEIVKLQGFGVWSAQMFLIFALARPDVWPVGDLGVQIGAQHYLRKSEKPTLTSMYKLGNKWKGHRSAASLLLWHIGNNKIKI